MFRLVVLHCFDLGPCIYIRMYIINILYFDACCIYIMYTCSCMCVGQRSSEGDLSAQPGSNQLEAQEKIGSTTQTIPSINEAPQLKILMRDELLIHVQKFTTQVFNFCSHTLSIYILSIYILNIHVYIKTRICTYFLGFFIIVRKY